MQKKLLKFQTDKQKNPIRFENYMHLPMDRTCVRMTFYRYFNEKGSRQFKNK